MVMAGGVGGHLFHGDDATFQLGADVVLELDGGVGNLEVFLEHMIEVDQDAGTFARWNVGDADVTGQGAGLRAEAPDVEVVDIDHAFDGLHAGTNLRKRAIAGGAFKENVERLADNAQTGPEDERGDEQREHRVDPVLPGEQDGGASNDDCGG